MNGAEQLLWAFVSASIGVWLALMVGYILSIRRRRRRQRLWRDNLAERQRAFKTAQDELARVATGGDPWELLAAETHVLALQTQLLIQLHFLDAEGIKEMPIYRPKP